MSSFGSAFRVTTFGESHCAAVGVIVDGVPAGMGLVADDVQTQLRRRRPGQSALTTPRNEPDAVDILSGTELGCTLGTPLAMSVRNLDHRPHDYSETDLFPRPSHADYTYLAKYGVKASSGGGRASARETIGRVAAGAVAEKYLREAFGIEIVAFVSAIGSISADPTAAVPQSALVLHETLGTLDGPDANALRSHAPQPTTASWRDSWRRWWSLLRTVTRSDVDKTDVRCPDAEAAAKMHDLIVRLRDANDSVGGTVTCVVRNVPAGLGEPCFDKLEAKLAHAMLSIPATKAFEIGSGFAGTAVPGSVHNDPFVAPSATDNNATLAGNKEQTPKKRVLHTTTNFSGGVQGGISNGADIYFKVGFKPAATISRPQQTANYDGVEGLLETRGRHDPSVLPRAVPVVEAMAAITIMDALVTQMGKAAVSGRLAMDHIPPILQARMPPQ